MINSTLLIILGILTLISLWFVGAYNKLIRLKAMVGEAWSGIDVQLKRRYDLIPNLVETVRGYSNHEKEIFQDIARARSVAMQAKGVDEKSKAEDELTQTLRTLFAVVENYPNLKANENFLSLQKELSHIEHELQLSRRYYNGTARQYNISSSTFPTNIAAAIGRFSKVPYFEVAQQHERENPQIKL